MKSGSVFNTSTSNRDSVNPDLNGGLRGDTAPPKTMGHISDSQNLNGSF